VQSSRSMADCAAMRSEPISLTAPAERPFAEPA
jgi:hypothetical protein